MLSPLDILPTRILLITATIDILLNEQRTFVQRVQNEIEERGLDRQRTVQILEFEGAIHGWLECKLFLDFPSKPTLLISFASTILRYR